jgi:hypothetical protein
MNKPNQALRQLPAIVGLRALKAGAAPYDHEAEWKKFLEADEATP